jgi:hypothetical protein
MMNSFVPGRVTIMSTVSKTKDVWDKLDIIAKVILIPLTIAIIGFIGNYQIAQINNRLTAETRDVDIVERFSNIYYYEENQDSRRLSIHYINLVDDTQTRYVLRKFIIWDTLERNITSNFKFDQELGDWHMVGDVIFDMAEDDQEKTNWFWCDLKTTTLERWPTNEVELSKLYEWVESVYQKADSAWADCS